MSDDVFVMLLYVGMPLGIMAVLSWLLHYFVALNSPPRLRAAWIAGVSYVLSSVLWMLGGPDAERWLGPIAALPGALLVYWFWQKDFERDWIDDAQEVPDGVELANTDWRVGLLGLVGLLVVAAVKVLSIQNAVGQ